MILAELDLIVVNTLSESISRCAIFQLLQKLQAANSNCKYLSSELNYSSVLILELPKVSFKLHLSLVDSPFTFKESVHLWNRLV